MSAKPPIYVSNMDQLHAQIKELSKSVAKNSLEKPLKQKHQKTPQGKQSNHG